MPRKLHYLTSSGQDICGEYYSSSACGLGDDADFEWDGTHKKEMATCKRCIAALAKPPQPIVPYGERAKPILFSGPMVRAILTGQKTVTRRLMPAWQVPSRTKEPDEDPRYNWIAVAQNHPRWGFAAFGETEQACADELTMIANSPYGGRFDRLWVRETWMDLRGTGVEHRPTPDSPLQRYAYGADSPPGSFSDEARKDFGLKWRPSIHMPRDACRLQLEITDVRAERLHDITVEQIIAEGLSTNLREHDAECDLRRQWRELWESTSGDWDSNPWVWAISFRRVTP
ncbi:hypothetical protein [Pseudomonas sp. C9-3]|nr:hypothetical protein [Pseudomonas sp. C9-3]